MQNYLQINKALRWVVILTALGICVASCESKNREELFPEAPIGGSTCDTVDVSYSQVIQPIFTGSCAISGCHDDAGASQSFGINLKDYQNVQNTLDSEQLLSSIKHESIYRMPKGLGKLSDCNIAKIESWVNNGRKNN